MTIEAGDDDVRKYTPEEDERLACQLRTIAEDAHAGRLWPMTLDQLREVHRRLFDGVREHAGHFRSRDYGDDRLTFGPNRSVPRDQVAPQLAVVLRKLEVDARELRADTSSPTYEIDSLRLALWTHAEIVRIHPFMDGNGRTSRTVMNAILVSLGLAPIAVEVPKQEYNEALNHYFRERGRDGALQVLLDLALGLVP